MPTKLEKLKEINEQIKCLISELETKLFIENNANNNYSPDFEPKQNSNYLYKNLI